jgi:hypothetical protein
MPTIFGREPVLSLQAAERTLVPSGFCNNMAAIGVASYFSGSRFYQGMSGVNQGQLVPNYTGGHQSSPMS